MKRVLTIAAVTAVVGGFLSGTAHAQPHTSLPIGFVTVNAGLMDPSAATFQNVASASDGVDTDELRADYRVKRNASFDIGGGVLLDRIVLGMAFSRYADGRAASATLNLTHPPFHPTITARQNTDSVDRTEAGVHVQLGYQLPLAGRLDVSVVGGPSHFAVTQGLISDLRYSETFSGATRTWSTAITKLETEKEHGSAWGYNVGADLSYRITRVLSVGALIRYTGATVTVEDPIRSLIADRTVSSEVQVGGLQTMGGIRVRF